MTWSFVSILPFRRHRYYNIQNYIIHCAIYIYIYIRNEIYAHLFIHQHFTSSSIPSLFFSKQKTSFLYICVLFQKGWSFWTERWTGILAFWHRTLEVGLDRRDRWYPTWQLSGRCGSIWCGVLSWSLPDTLVDGPEVPALSVKNMDDTWVFSYNLWVWIRRF